VVAHQTWCLFIRSYCVYILVGANVDSAVITISMPIGIIFVVMLMRIQADEGKRAQRRLHLLPVKRLNPGRLPSLLQLLLVATLANSSALYFGDTTRSRLTAPQR
jgi:multisubunit Na+/H+ antiporter MnhE subunit